MSDDDFDGYGEERHVEPQDPPAPEVGRKLIGPSHAHLDAPCTEACYEPAAAETQTFQLVEVVLGLRPYTLIEAKYVTPDEDDPDDDGLRVAGRYGGGADAGALPLLWLTSLPAEQNPLTAAVKALLDAYPAAEALAESLETFAEYVGFPMHESGK